jgi:hypothetical protein
MKGRSTSPQKTSSNKKTRKQRLTQINEVSTFIYINK